MPIIHIKMWASCAIGTITGFRKIFIHAGVVFWGQVSLFGGIDSVMAITPKATRARNGNGKRQAPVFVVWCRCNMSTFLTKDINEN